jgi:uncharacterized protein YegL
MSSIFDFTPRITTTGLGATPKTQSPNSISISNNDNFIVLILDESGSMNENSSNQKEAEGYTRRDLACQGAMLCVKSFPVGTKIAVIAFESRARIVCDPIVITSDNIPSICSKILGIRPTGGTNIKASLHLAKTMNPKRVILMTDGEDSDLTEGKGIEQKFQDLKTNSEFTFAVDTIGLGPNADTKLLVKIADLFRGVYVFCPSAFEVGTVFGRAAARAYLPRGDVFCIAEPNQPPTNVCDETKNKFIYFKDKLANILLDESYTFLQLNKQLPELVKNISEFDSEISTWLQQNYQRLKESEYLQFIIDIRTDLYDQIFQSIENEATWKKWGKTYWTATGTAFKLCYSPHSKDLCLSHFGSEKALQEYERISQVYESMPLVEKTGYVSPEAVLVQAIAGPMSTQTFNDRDAGCFHPTSTFQTLDGRDVDYDYIVTNIQDNKEVWLRGWNNLPVKIECVIKTPRKGVFTSFCKVNNTILTPTHPILDNGTWKHPKRLTSIYEEQVDFVINVVLAIDPNNGKRYQSLCVNREVCVALGHNIEDGSDAEDSFWGSERVVDELKRLYPIQYEKGFIENADHSMIHDKKTGYIIGFSK